MKKSTGFIRVLLSRLISFATVVALGLLLLLSLVVDALLDGFMKELRETFPGGAVFLIHVANLLISFAATTVLFGVIFKILPGAHMRWKDVLAGALFTAVLFTLVRLGITPYILNSDLGSSYAAAGSSVAVLLWIYFSAMILYFGAEFTKFYAITFGPAIKPNAFAVIVQKVRRESGAKTLQENEEEIERQRANKKI